MAGKTFPAFPAHAQPAILHFWSEAYVEASWFSAFWMPVILDLIKSTKLAKAHLIRKKIINYNTANFDASITIRSAHWLKNLTDWQGETPRTTKKRWDFSEKVNTFIFVLAYSLVPLWWFLPAYQYELAWVEHFIEHFTRYAFYAFYALLALCAGNSPVTGEFPAQRPLTRSFNVFFDLRLNKRLSKHLWGLWVETPSRSLWLHCNDRGDLITSY